MILLPCPLRKRLVLRLVGCWCRPLLRKLTGKIDDWGSSAHSCCTVCYFWLRPGYVRSFPLNSKSMFYVGETIEYCRKVRPGLSCLQSYLARPGLSCSAVGVILIGMSFDLANCIAVNLPKSTAQCHLTRLIWISQPCSAIYTVNSLNPLLIVNRLFWAISSNIHWVSLKS